jgi:hypothetical protein
MTPRLARLDRAATGRRVLVCLGLVGALLAAANVAGTLFYHGNGGLGFLDFRGAANALTQDGPYTAERALDLVSAWGPAGRRAQLLFTLLIDIALPAVGLAFSALALLHAMRHLGAPPWLRYVVLILPLAYLLADYGENVGITALVLTHPHRLVDLAETTAWFNVAKVYTLEATLTLITVSYLAVLLRRLATLHSHSTGR